MSSGNIYFHKPICILPIPLGGNLYLLFYRNKGELTNSPTNDVTSCRRLYRIYHRHGERLIELTLISMPCRAFSAERYC